MSKMIENTQICQFLLCKWPHYHFSMVFMMVYINICKLFKTFSFSVNAMGSLVVHCCLLILLLIEISTAFVTKRPSFNNNLCKKTMLQGLCNPCLVAFLSLLLRMLLLRSGNVESNPGPRPNSFSIGCWNVDSLLTREGVKKDYLETIQSIHHFDLFGICETYLNNDKQNQ